MKKKTMACFAVLLALALLAPAPVCAAPVIETPLSYTLQPGSIHLDLHDEAAQALTEGNPFAVAAYLKQQYEAAGYTDFAVPLWQFAFELAGHAIVARRAPEDDDMYARAIVADCGVSALDEDAEVTIAMAVFYYETAGNMPRILFGL